MSRTIQLSQSKQAIVDDDDYALVAAYKWHAVKNGQNWYAHTKVPHPQQGGRVSFSMHRLILGLDFGDRREGDHVNGNGLDNRRANLRISTHSQNSKNRKNHKPGSSRFKGVSWHVHSRKWHAQIQCDGVKHTLGYFQDETDAAKAYDVAAKELHGAHARTNE